MTHSPDESRMMLPRPTCAVQDGETMSPVKIAVIVGLALATLVPNYFVAGLIAERETRQDAVEKEFTRNWGPQQHLYSPVLIVPYQAAPDRLRQYLKISSTRLDLVANIAPQERRRGLFHATVYEARLDMQGAFVLPGEARLKDLITEKDGRFLWDESFIVFGTTTSLSGLRSDDHISINGVDTPWQPCLEVIRREFDCRNLSVVLARAQLNPIAAAGGGRVAFKSTVGLRGTSAFNLIYVGKELDATIRSPWRTPSFGGNVLPAGSSVTAQGFDAHWQISEFGSPPIATSGAIVDAAMWKSSTSIGVDLIEATPIYRMITRVAKYGLLFVVLSFATYFFFEVLSRLRIHVVQYGLLTASLSLFPLLLLSLSEPIGYAAGYVVSAGLVLLQSSLYTASVAKRVVPTLMFAAIQAGLFICIYVLLALETYSLIVGALALFAVLSVLMILTQRVNWQALTPGRAALS
jgi:inner membrane protein